MTTQQPLYYMGIDGGGSKCRALLTDAEGKELGTGQSGPANPNQGLDQSLNSILDCATQAIDNAGLPASTIDKVYAGMGLAGLNLPKYYQWMANWDHPFARLNISTDLHIACLGAHGGGDGAVIITGTGSCGMVNVKGQRRQFGGHGFTVGDQGSGAWLGINAIRQSLQALDGLLPKTDLVERVLDLTQCQTARELAQTMAGQSPAKYAKLAPVVFEQANVKDELATELVIKGADYINRLARRLFGYNPPRFSMIGGLAPIIAPWLDEDVKERLQPSLHSPEMGAVLFAQQDNPKRDTL
ncbi:Glucosamine kinase [Saliniradius amylolyticus]|uniref:Glucosamine kinase n=1 Tax=Saliniradius amylolyticus TaxID=2183582 RepID=A0A2S2E2V8_9ALTE|nr:BadF/BadG/BcrA/BcrD ATPase family protein [Saliniradius amylolyticus]AWL11974.1 Glucosamine kinase [Saliniradius amylolyticus]